MNLHKILTYHPTILRIILKTTLKMPILNLTWCKLMATLEAKILFSCKILLHHSCLVNHLYCHCLGKHLPINPHMAMVASSSGLNGNMWYPDSGATHHVTANGANLSMQVNSGAVDSIFMGNGHGLKVHSVGKTLVNSSYDDTVRFTL